MEMTRDEHAVQKLTQTAIFIRATLKPDPKTLCKEIDQDALV